MKHTSDDLTALPDVTVIIATRDRPQLLSRALNAITSSDYDGDLKCLVVFDQSTPDRSIEFNEGNRAVAVTSNSQSNGLAGARNTGMLAAETELVAFCDDDDEWLPGKLSKQVAALTANPNAHFAATGIVIAFDGDETPRIPDPRKLTRTGFLADRMTEVHPSSFLFERQWMIDTVGLVDEQLPGGYAEDYDVLLRVIQHSEIAIAEEALVRIHWHGASFFFERWQMIDKALTYLLQKHPDFATVPKGLARIAGQQAFARAAIGDRRGAWSASRTALGASAFELRAYLSLVIAFSPLTAERCLKTAHRFGKGI
ncbi:MAG: glycosyltransferase involved in cell wall biosynthesis [Candidatus Poriferisodalaceae bacterium]|jgi:glycosyltransferase involved in cell wall biosynthesis